MPARRFQGHGETSLFRGFDAVEAAEIVAASRPDFLRLKSAATFT
jgi:hypothetical protein